MACSAEEIRTSSNERLMLEVIDPWLVALQTAEAFVAAPPQVRAIVCVWTLQAQASRNGISSFVAEDHTVVGDFVPEAARILDLPWLAERWARATAGMDRAGQHGKIPSKVVWGDPATADLLEDELASHQPIDVTRHALRYLRDHADELAPAT